MSKDPDPNQTARVEKTYTDCGFTESIDEAFATLQETQIELSHMADSKANIMITVCSILLTLVVAQIQKGILIYPSVLFALFSALALFFAILCVMPSVAPPKFGSGEAEIPKSFNLMFFMNFSRLPVERFVTELEKIMTDPKELYESLTRDVYYAGAVLAHKKYRYLRWSYINLMLGVAVGIVALGAELIFGD